MASDPTANSSGGETLRETSRSGGLRPESLAARNAACGSLYPGGHGEDRECVLAAGHDGPHKYSRTSAAACDCHLHENQVCDACQGVDPDNPAPDVEPSAAFVSREEYERVKTQRDNLFARLEADPGRAAVATLDGLRKVWTEDGEQCHRILDWIGVAADNLALPERVRILVLELAAKQGYTLDDAERLCPPAFEEVESNG